MQKVLPSRAWTVLPSLTLLLAASTHSALANQNHERLQERGPRMNNLRANSPFFRANSFNLKNDSFNSADVQAATPRFNSFITDLGVIRSISRKLDFDLGSTRANIMLGTKMFDSQSSVTIDVGGTQKTLTAESRVTPAEYVAALQRLEVGSQSLTLNKDGQGVGGSFTLDSIDNAGKIIRASDLVVPEGVTGIGNFGRGSDFRVTGDLVNSGNVYALSNNPGANLATISARNIINESSGVISSEVPLSVLTSYGETLSQVDLRLKADRDIVNQGAISSSGKLDLVAGRSIGNFSSASGNQGVVSAVNDVNVTLGAGDVTNSGTIVSTTGSINFASTVSSQDLNVLNSGGTLRALSGNINFRDSNYSDAGNINFFGGDLYSQQVNLHSGTGTADLIANDVTGVVNVNAACTHILADTPDLKFGTINLTGDPTFYNTGGNINLAGVAATNGFDLAIVATGDVLVTGGTIDTTSAAGNAGNVIIVSGANITAPGSGSGLPDVSSTTVTLTNSANPGKGSVTGGKVDLTGVTAINTNAIAVGKSGGFFQVIAYAGSGVGSGSITIPNAVTIDTSGKLGGANGNVVMIAGASTGAATITAGGITTSGASAATGTILVSTATPIINGSGSISILNGTIQGGSGAFIPDTTLKNGGIAISGTLSTAAAGITLSAGQDIKLNQVLGASVLNATALGSVSLDNTSVGRLVVTSQGSASNGIVLNGDLTAPGGIALIAARDIVTANPGLDISTTSSTGTSGEIVMIAGASFTQSASAVSILGASVNGGRIDFETQPITSIKTNTTFVGGSGGGITLIAYDGAVSNGSILLDSSSSILTGGKGGISGGVQVVSGTNDKTIGIKLGTVTTTGSNGSSGGSISLETSIPFPLFSLTYDVITSPFISPGIFGTATITAGGIQTGNLTTPSANIMVVSGHEVQLGDLDANAAAANSNGGVITVESNFNTALTVGGAGKNNIKSMTANGGATFGGGGAYQLKNSGTGGITITKLNPISVTDGPGGAMSFDAGSGALSLPVSSLSVDGGGVGNNGGVISLTGSTISPTSLKLSANGTGDTIDGSGGQINITQTGSSDLIIDPSNIQISATGENGGSVSITAAGKLIVDPSALVTTATGLKNFHHGGTIFLRAATIENAGAGPLVLNASAAPGGLGFGGSITVRQTDAPATVSVASDGDFQLTSNGSTLGGSGGTITVVTNTNLTVEQSGINVNPLGPNSKGGTMILQAGVDSGSGISGGNLLVDGNLSAPGSGTGTGGSIQLFSNSATDFTVLTKAAKPINGVFGTLSGGTVTINSLASGISILSAMTGQAKLNLIADKTITTSAALGDKKATAEILIQSNNGNFVSTSKKALLTALNSITFDVAGSTGTAAAPILFNSGALTFDLGGDAFLVNKAKGEILINSSTTKADFSLTAAGNINNGSGVAITGGAGTVTLISTKGGIGTTTPLLTKVNSLSVNSKKGTIDIQNSGSGVLSLEDSNGSGILTISSSIDISVAGSIGTSKATVDLLATGTAKIQNGGGTVIGAVVNLASAAGSIGDAINGSLQTEAKTLLATAGTSIDIVDTADSVILGAMTANNGDLLVETAANTKSLSVGSKSGPSNLNAVNGMLVLQQTNTSKGTINITAGSKVETSGAGGDVYIYIGTVLPAKTNPLPAGAGPNILVTNTGGQVFAGTNGFTASAPVNNLTTIGKDIVFDMPAKLSAKNIILGGGVLIKADPPLPEGIVITAPDATNDVLSMPETHVQLNSKSAPDTVASVNLSPAFPTTLLDVPNPQADVIPTVLWNGSATGMMRDRLQPAGISLFSDSIVELPPSAPPHNLDEEFGLVDAALFSNEDLGVEQSEHLARLETANNKVTLKSGNALFAPNVDTIVETPIGTIRIDAKSLVLVVVNERTLAVYNLDDNHRNAVAISVGKRSTELSPGTHLAVTSSRVRDFESINPCLSFAYRHLDCVELENGMKTFHGQFHVPSAVASVKQLKQLVNSTKPEARRVSRHLLKTAAVLLQLHSDHSDFQLKRPSTTTAWLN